MTEKIKVEIKEKEESQEMIALFLGQISLTLLFSAALTY